VLQDRVSGGVDKVVEWLALNDSYLSVIVPVSFISTVVVIIIVCVACRRRRCTSKPPSPPPPPPQTQPQRGCSAPTTSSVTTTTYLPATAPTTSNGLDEYTRCFVAPRRLDSTAAGWTSAAGSPSMTTHGVKVVGPTASLSPRQPLMSPAPPAMRSDVRYRIYEECWVGLWRRRMKMQERNMTNQ